MTIRLSEHELEQLADYIFDITGTTAKNYKGMHMGEIFEVLDTFSKRQELGWSDDEISDRTRAVFHKALEVA